jgi:integrase
MPVDTITAEDVASVLRPIWRKVPETSGQLRGRIENILDAAKASKHIASPWENPARWKGNLVYMLPRQRRKVQVKHHAATPYEQMPDFFASLRRRGAPVARALALTILCATRTNETLWMTWSEADFDAGVWTIPGVRMKMGIEHRIPLPPFTLQIGRRP